MSAKFPENARGTRGYRRESVDEFLESARVAYDSLATTAGALTSQQIRHTSFPITKKGYATGPVDAALERLEDAFALRERELWIAEHGQEAWLARVRETAQVLLNRLARPETERFDRAGRMTAGYSVDSVDAFANQIRDYFQDGQTLSLSRVRTVVFPAQRGGYSEQQVDLVLDEVVDVMLAVR